MDPYHVLGVPEGASPKEITEAYKILVQIYHPDRYAGAPDDVRLAAERRMAELTEAYRIVKSGPPPASRGTGVVKSAAVWLGTAPGTWARYARRSGTPDPRAEDPVKLRETIQRAANEHQSQARVAREARVQAEQAIPHGEARARPKPRMPGARTRSTLGGLGRALHTNELACRSCRSLQRLPAGWRDRLDDTNFYCSVCDRLILSR